MIYLTLCAAVGISFSGGWELGHWYRCWCIRDLVVVVFTMAIYWALWMCSALHWWRLPHGSRVPRQRSSGIQNLAHWFSMSEQIFPLPLPCQTLVLCYVVEAASLLDEQSATWSPSATFPQLPVEAATEPKLGEKYTLSVLLPIIMVPST